MRLEVFLLLGFALVVAGSKQCNPVYVRWPRVKLNVAPAADGAFSLTACKSACTNEEDPLKSGIEQQCSGFNHKQGPNQYTHNCQLFPREKVQHVDGYIEADDRYSYFWKYCVNTNHNCGGDYAFTFLSDRYMAESEVSRLHFSATLEECLSECLNEKAFLCRSVSFNRTDGGCHLSQQNQLSKPSLIKLNNNPNYRIDYYENNCYNISDSFHFDYKCEENGIRVSVKSKFPYSGALYGLYDFFSCRVEPKEETDFGYLFPYPTLSKNCSDSIRYKGNDMVLEVVLSTDGVEPLYFITPDDLTYQARCPIRHTQPSIDASPLSDSSASNASKSTAEFAASAHALFSMLANSSVLAESQPVVIQKTTTKDTFPLPLVTTASPKPHKDDEKKVAQTKKFQIHHCVHNYFCPFFLCPCFLHVVVHCRLLSFFLHVHDPLHHHFPFYCPHYVHVSFDSVHLHLHYYFSYFLYLECCVLHLYFCPRYFDLFVVAILFVSRIPQQRLRFQNLSHFPHSQHDSRRDQLQPSDDEGRLPTSRPRCHRCRHDYGSRCELHDVDGDHQGAEAVLDHYDDHTIDDSFEHHVDYNVDDDHHHANYHHYDSSDYDQDHHQGSGAPGHVGSAKEPIFFDVFHNSQPVQAVVVGSRITLSFTPYLAIDPSYISITGCQVEPIGSIYEWEKEPLAIIKDGCPADHVGLVCPPQKTPYGWRVTVESFRYQTTAQVQYTCLIRVCPFAPCPETKCQPVEGCEEQQQEDLLHSSLKSVFATLGSRAKRASLSLEQIKAALEANPRLQQQIGLRADSVTASPGSRMNAVSVAALQQQLLAIGGDHKVTKRLVVLNSEEDLRYYVQTGLSDYRPGYGRKK
ncbi:hypothetical protein QR680_004997 [Steinernema hermaphroditum]|uniref:Apple domain-containing protein n=1 Tax=Steinernema hermaphroditum TaxID=289476 RepID=A0AA39HSS7_9BILA|nr:hypothetical protein QR680_004997 [Steinernema hermaphroditum]